jgi:hypothetical protein
MRKRWILQLTQINSVANDRRSADLRNAALVVKAMAQLPAWSACPYYQGGLHQFKERLARAFRAVNPTLVG